MRARAVRAGVLLFVSVVAACQDPAWPPPLQQLPAVVGPLSPSEALQTFYLPPGFRIELVAAEPLVEDPVAIDFDADGRMYVAEMRGYMPNLEAEGEQLPVGRVVVLEDLNGDGRMDRSTVFADSLVLPRAVRVLSHGVLVATPPHVWLMRDTTGDLRADIREVVRSDYGDPAVNPEHNANGLYWGMDNWIHNSQYDGQFRLRREGFEHRYTVRRGQWGVSSDDYGRMYRNWNNAPLFADLVPAHYFARNPNLTRTRGAYERLAPQGPVWPARPTPGVNRGYREGQLRPDSTLMRFTAAGSPVVYRGELLPAELQNNVFVTEPAAHFVRRLVVSEDEEGFLTADNAYEEAEFLTSTDERFRPVNLYSAPDGALYVIDMYRGVIQHRYYLTEYLKHHVRQRSLEDPGSYGRIYRIVPDRPGWRRVFRRSPRAEPPQLAQASSAELVRYLEHPNGWWRDRAQQLLVEHGDAGVAAQLRDLARSAGDERVRLHALWALEGVDALDAETVVALLIDESPHVRAAALRVSEPWLAEPHHPVRDALFRLRDDPSPIVRRQLAASFGELPVAEHEPVLLDMLRRYGYDPVVVDLVVSALHQRELSFLQRWLDEAPAAKEVRSEVAEILAATVMRSGEDTAIEQVIHWAGDAARPRWQRLALIAGITSFIPEPRASDVTLFELRRRPDALLMAARSEHAEVRTAAEELLRRVDWPGRPIPPDRTREQPLTAEERQRFTAGMQSFANACAACHQMDGRGISEVAPTLVGSQWVLGSPQALVRIVLHGMDGEMLMPPMGGVLSDEELAAVLTYIRREWGHRASPIDPAVVREIRGETTGRARPWTPEELAEIAGG